MTQRPTDCLNRAKVLVVLGTGLLALGLAGEGQAATVVQAFATPFTVTSFTRSSIPMNINVPSYSYAV